MLRRLRLKTSSRHIGERLRHQLGIEVHRDELEQLKQAAEEYDKSL
jgi:Arc/MetJ family transcription regulator